MTGEARAFGAADYVEMFRRAGNVVAIWGDRFGVMNPEGIVEPPLDDLHRAAAWRRATPDWLDQVRAALAAEAGAGRTDRAVD